MPTTISGNFTVSGVPFAQWFKTLQASNKTVFPHTLVEANFNKLISDLALLTGKPQTSLNEFIGHFAIIYNETGGQCTPLREYGGIEYMFNAIPGTKKSYNTLSTNRKAGDQLKAWGVISAPADVTLWNGEAWPAAAPQNVKDAARNCDFFKYRGWGLNQLTGRTNYQANMQPFLTQDIEKLTTDQFDALIKNDTDLACKVFNKFTLSSSQAKKAIADLEAGVFETYGKLVSGSSKYVNEKYMPRINALVAGLKNATIAPYAGGTAPAQKKYAIDGMNLSKAQIIDLQKKIMNAGNAQAKSIIQNSGGADGAWGDNTEKAFRLLNITIDQLMKM